MKGVIRNEYNENYPWILFLHGWGQSKESLLCIEHNTQTFANSLLIDLPGFGELSPLAEPYDIEEYLFYIKSVLRELSIEPSLIVGHSFGGKIATYYASQVQEIPLLLLAPSIIPNGRSLKKQILSKIKPLFLFLWRKGIIKKMPRFYLGSLDYQKSTGYLRSTFVRMVHRYPLNSIKDIMKRTIIYLGDDDHEVPNARFTILTKMNSKIEIYKIKGNHFAFRRHDEEIALKIHELMENELC